MKIKPEKIILISGILLFAMSWVMEINFHFIQGFQPETIPEDIFWRAEQSIYPISTFLFIYGIFLILIYVKLKKNNKKSRSGQILHNNT